MKWVRTCLAWVVLAATAATAHADAFTADQLRLGEIYARGADPIAAVAPLLNVLRRGRAAGEAEYLGAKLTLAQAYTTLGLLASAERLVESLAGEPGAWPDKARELRLRMAVRRGEPGAILAALEGARRGKREPVAGELVFAAAVAAFAGRPTDFSVSRVEALFEGDPRPEAVYLRGVCALTRGDAELAYERFRSAIGRLDRAKHRELYDATVLALGRLYYERGDYASAETYYAMVGEGSALLDRVLFETAWVYVAENDVTAATGNLMRLAIDFPFSALVPKAQVLYGYMMLRQGRFAHAERVFGAYVAHYTAVNEIITDLNAAETDDGLYDQVFADVGGAIAEGRNARIEVMAWLKKNQRVRAANRLIAKLQSAEAELNELTRVLREVQSVAESGWAQEAPGSAASQLEAAAPAGNMEAEARRAARRLTGRRLEAYRNIERQLAEAGRMRAGIERMHRRVVEKRRELVSLLQYADAARWSVWDEDGRLRADGVTEPALLGPQRAARSLTRLDEGERRILDTLGIISRIERRAMLTRNEIIAPLLPAERRRRFASHQAQWEQAVERDLFERGAEVAERLATARIARRRVDERLKTVAAMRERLVVLSRDAVDTRGRIAREELIEIERSIGSLLVHARLGNADVAWEMRSYAQRRAAAVARSEQADAAALRSFYDSLGERPAYQAPASESLTGSTAQKVAILKRRVDADQAALDSTGGVLLRQSAASRSLIERLRDGGNLGVWLPRTEAAGILVLSPQESTGLRVAASTVAVDGRVQRNANADVLVDDYLPPGLHQIDVAVHAVAADGASHRLRGSLLVNLEAARGYRVKLRPRVTAAGLRLDIELETEAVR